MKIKIMKAMCSLCMCDLNHDDKSSRCIINLQIRYTYMNIIMQRKFKRTLQDNSRFMITL